MVDDDEWSWIVEHARGDFDHLLIATTVPFLLSPGLHHLEAWSERVCDGAWGAARGEGLREAPARRRLRPLGVVRLVLRAAARADRGDRLRRSRRAAEVDRAALGRRPPRLPRRGRVPARRAGCEAPSTRPSARPIATPSSERERRVIRAGFSRPFTRATRALARSAGAPDPGIGWRLAEGPYFDNQVATPDDRRPRRRDEAGQDRRGRGGRAPAGVRLRASARLTPSASAMIARDARHRKSGLRGARRDRAGGRAAGTCHRRGDRQRAGDPAALPREDPRRAAPGRNRSEPARGGGRIRAGSPGRGDHPRRGDPRRRRPPCQRPLRASRGAGLRGHGCPAARRLARPSGQPARGARRRDARRRGRR